MVDIPKYLKIWLGTVQASRQEFISATALSTQALLKGEQTKQVCKTYIMITVMTSASDGAFTHVYAAALVSRHLFENIKTLLITMVPSKW